LRRPGGRRAARLPLALLLATRHLKSARRDAFASFLSLVAGGGMAVGVAALLLSLAALSGFQVELREEILSRTPEIAIAVEDRELADQVVEEIWRVAGVQEVQLTMSGLGWLVAEGGIEAVELVGYEGDVPVHFPGASTNLTGLFVPETLAKSWLLEVGDTVEVVSGRPILSPIGPQPRVRRLPLMGTFSSGKVEHRLRAAVPLIDAEALFGGDYEILISTRDLGVASSVAAELAERLPESTSIETWQDLNRALFFALRLEKAIMFLGVLLIILVASLALVSDLSLIIANKRREVGMLRAMGIKRSTLQASFFLFGSGLAVAGMTSGAVLGLGGAALLDRYRLLRLPESVYFLDYVPFLVQPLDVVLVVMAAVVVALAATMYATRGVVHLAPVEALRR